MTRVLLNMSRNLLDAGFNPVAAYRSRGQRYARFVTAKVAFLGCVAAIAILTLVAPFAGDDYFPTAYKLAMLDLQAAGVLMPYLALESLYWWYRLRREAATR